MPPTKKASPSDSAKLQKLLALEEKRKLVQGLPHLYGYKMYPWTRKYFESTNKIQVICAGNQISKSSSQIRKAIHWATDTSLWKTLWPHLKHPRTAWYLYPSNYLASVEFEKKWQTEFLPQGEFKKHPQYGWRVDYRSRYVQAIHFNTGFSIYFKTYSQSPEDLQAGTCAAVFCDEEIDELLIPELQARLLATDGYFSAVFTPTLGQEFWREVVEERGPKERFKEAFKLQVSMYDCEYYEDGTPSFWTKERIEKIKAGCKSEAEVQRRVYGRFVLDSGLRYPAFTAATNVIMEQTIPEDWWISAGVDFGSGGKHNHPSAITFTAIRPDNQQAYVFKGMRFDGATMTASDLIEEVLRMKEGINNPFYGIYYDYSCTDLREISARMGQVWIPAEKSHLIGEQVLNVGFKNHIISIFNIPELQPLVTELKLLKLATPKNMAKDDFCFVAGTKIKTPHKDVCIEDLRIGDLVLTRSGDRRVLATGSRDAVVLETKFSNGAVIISTEDHPFWVEGFGFKKCSLLTVRDTVLTFNKWQNQKLSYFMALHLGGIQNQNRRRTETTTGLVDPRSNLGYNTYTKRYGNLGMDLFQKDTPYITRMGTHSIIQLQISNVFQLGNISETIFGNGLKKIQSQYYNILEKLGRSLKNGMHQKMVLSGTDKMVLPHGKKRNLLLKFALCVIKNIKQKLNITGQNTAVVHAGPEPEEFVRVVSQKKLLGKSRVYNLTIETDHEYFANGLLVSNCDSLRYSVAKIPFDWSIIGEKPASLPPRQLTEAEERKKMFEEDVDDRYFNDINTELEAWDSLINEY